MATWIVHLRLAENLLPLIEGVDIPQFTIGNIAPDSGIPDEKWEKFDPPSEVTHFRTSQEIPWRIEDLEFYRNYLVPVAHQDDQVRFSFLLGYFLHLITDNLWYDRIYRPIRARFATEFETEPGFIWEVKRDWYGLDFSYVRNRPESLFWRTFLESTYTQNYLEFLPQEAVQHNLRHIKTFYQRTDEEVENRFIKRPGIYLSEMEMDHFVNETTQYLYQIYQGLWEKNVNTSGISSALEFPFHISET